MNSTKPYLIRAFYEWINDCNFTPYIIVNAECSNVMVPKKYIKDGQIVLNIAMHSVQDLQLQNDAVSFKASFDGIINNIYIPTTYILAIYARENGHGMVFASKKEKTESKNIQNNIQSNHRSSHLTIIK